MPFCTYCESVCTIALHGRFKASSAAITAISSIRLFVVFASPPNSSFSWSPKRRMAPQPPGPGLPLQAPSVKMSIRSDVIVVACVGRGSGREACGKHGFLHLDGADEAHGAHALDRRHHVGGAENRPPAVAGGFHERVAVEPHVADEGRTIAAEAPAIKVEA